MPDEYIDILDESGNKTGCTKLRSEVHRDGDWHRAVHIWIINSRGDILLQRRAKNKDSYPGLLDISAGGHLQAGDEPLQGAIREVREEIGLDFLPTEFKLFLEYQNSTIPRPGFINNCFFSVYLVRTDKMIDEMKMQVDEVSELKFVPYQEFKRMVATRDPDMVPHPVNYPALINLLEPEFGETLNKGEK